MSVSIASKVYTLDMVRSEAQELLYRNVVQNQQPIATLLQYLPRREWYWIEQALESHEFLMRDRIISLFSQEDWRED